MGMEELVNRRLNKVGDGNIYAYKFVKKLGRGGFGQVWKVQRDGKEYALKAPLNIDIKPGYLQRTYEPPNLEIDLSLIEREARTWARLTDKCPDAVVCLLDFNTDPFPWMLMELAECDLNTELKKGNADVNDFCELLVKLQKIHDINVIHRDIKPCNILKVDGEWKFSDFGLSKVLSGTSSNMGFGTLYYMAPEQILRNKFGNTSKRTDLWAMGIMLMKDFLELDPYPDSIPNTIYARIVMEGPDLTELPDEFIPSLDQVLKLDQEKRLKNCIDFLNMIPWDYIPEGIEKELGISGIHSIKDNYEQYWIFDQKTNRMLIFGTGTLDIKYPEGIAPEEVIIGEGITRIERCRISNSRSIMLPSSITSIEDSAFFGCDLLESIYVDKRNKDYCDIDGFLYSSDKTTLIRVPPGIEDKKCTIPSGVTSIGDSAFYYCSCLQSITIPSGVTSIGPDAFSCCTSLQTVKIPSSVTSIGDYAFFSCNCLQSITIPSGVTSIGDSAFFECTSLQSIEIPNSVTSIGPDAFNRCTSLQTVKIPSSVTSIGDYAFADCTSLEYINVDKNNNNYYEIDGCLYNSTKNELIIVPPGLKKTEYLVPSNVLSIEAFAFENCLWLRKVIISDSVKSIGYGTFDKCIALEEIKVSKKNKTFCDIEGCLYNTNKTELIRVPPGLKKKEYTILPGVASIGSCALADCIYIQNVEIPHGVKSIGNAAFCRTTIKKIEFPKSVRTIGESVFMNCNFLESVLIPLGVKSIGSFAFHDCTSLKDVAIPAEVKISNYAFDETTIIYRIG